MSNLFSRLLTKQVPMRWLGTFRQLFGGAATWITFAILIFTAVTAWNTPTAIVIREYLPWLSLGIFVALIFLAMAVAIWIEHKFIQPAIMLYWNRMHFKHGNPQQEQLDRIEIKLDKLLESHDEPAEHNDNDN